MQIHVRVRDCDFPILGNTAGAAFAPHLMSPGTGAAALIFQWHLSGEAEPGCAGYPEEKGSQLPLAPPGQLEPGHWNMGWPSACGVGLLLSWHGWDVGQSQNLSDSSERQPAPWLLCSSLQTGYCEKHNSEPKTSDLLQLENPETEFQGHVKHQDKSVVLPCTQIQVGLSKALLRKRNQRTVCLCRTVQAEHQTCFSTASATECSHRRCVQPGASSAPDLWHTRVAKDTAWVNTTEFNSPLSNLRLN